MTRILLSISAMVAVLSSAPDIFSHQTVADLRVLALALAAVTAGLKATEVNEKQDVQLDNQKTQDAKLDQIHGLVNGDLQAKFDSLRQEIAAKVTAQQKGGPTP